MFKCPSCPEQHCATCLIQSMQFACCVLADRWKEKLSYLLLTPMSQSYALSHHRSSHSTLSCVRPCKSTAGSLLCMIAGRGNVTWVLCFWVQSLSSSHGAKVALVNLKPDEQNFTSARTSYYLQLGIITCTGYRVPLSPTLYIIRSDQPIYTVGIWQEMSERSGMILCVCVCGSVWQDWTWGELGNPISHTEEQRQAERCAAGRE